MSEDDDPAYTPADWRPRYQRLEPIGSGSGLLLRILLIEHRREPGRAVLMTQCFRQGDRAEELSKLGGSAIVLDGVSAERCRHLFDECVECLRPGRAGDE